MSLYFSATTALGVSHPNNWVSATVTLLLLIACMLLLLLTGQRLYDRGDSVAESLGDIEKMFSLLCVEFYELRVVHQNIGPATTFVSHEQLFLDVPCERLLLDVQATICRLEVNQKIQVYGALLDFFATEQRDFLEGGGHRDPISFFKKMNQLVLDRCYTHPIPVCELKPIAGDLYSSYLSFTLWCRQRA